VLLDCLDDVADRPRFFMTCTVPRERLAEVFVALFVCPFFVERAACFRVLALALREGGFTFTPALRALLSPIAMACLLDFAPCFP
jgi:hypothetical protein